MSNCGAGRKMGRSKTAVTQVARAAPVLGTAATPERLRAKRKTDTGIIS